ncbi:MAG: hypothetical protein CL420_05545 [Acidimicrobiaceae bacterium]|jgi:hypothetical protein|nr:hypothetical protein [Acidimicrobiaceae bacterium]
MSHALTKNLHKASFSIVAAWLTSRAIVLITMWLTHTFATDHYREFTSQGFRLWDAGWYQQIITVGYEQVGQESFRFFPGFVLIGRLVTQFLGGNEVWASLLVANVFSLITFLLLYQLIVSEGGSARRAKRTVWVFSVFPASFVLIWGYAESMFLTFTLLFFLSLRKQNWKVAAIFACMAGLTRPTGALLFFAAISASGFSLWRGNLKERAEQLLACLGGPLGVAIFLLWSNSRTSENWLPFTVQREFRGGFIDPFRRVWSGFSEILNLEADAFHVLVALFFLVLLVVIWKRLPRQYFWYSFVTFVVSVSAENLNSLERYLMTAFPFVMALVILSEGKRSEKLIYPISALGLTGLTAISFLGIYVP